MNLYDTLCIKDFKKVNGDVMKKNENDTGESHENSLVPKENYNFVQVSREYLADWRKLTRKNPLASEILMYLVEHMGRTSNAVVCSYQTLIDITGTSRPTVGRAIKLLKDDNWVQAVKVGSATAYAVNAKVFWQAGRNQKQYAVFQATVIAGASEQDSDFSKKAKEPLRHIPFIGEPKKTRLITDETEPLTPPDQQDLDLN